MPLWAKLPVSISLISPKKQYRRSRCFPGAQPRLPRTLSKTRSMLLHAVLAIVAAHFCVPVTAELDCSVSLSCSGIPGTHVDPCCTPSPGGIFIFKQRLQLDVADDLGRWGIDSLQILECVTMNQSSRTSALGHDNGHLAVEIR